MVYYDTHHRNRRNSPCPIRIITIQSAFEKQGKTSMGISEATKQKLEDSLNNALEKETPESFNEFLDEQGEQKPAEEYNITGIGSKNAQGKLGEMIKNIKPVNEVLEQKPAWSKEDSSLCTQIQGILSVCRCYNLLSPNLYKKMCDWLKSLRPQNWTKEDKERYISCLQRLSTGNPEQPETINSKWFKEHVYPLSTWRPSEEQLKALKEAVDEHFDIDGGALWHLYEDLKKLREE